MQKLTNLLFILCLILISCNDDIDEFVPNDVSIVYSQLQNIGPSSSSSFDLNNNIDSKVNTIKDLEIQIPINTFNNSSESNDIPFQLDIIELDSYVGFITNNITHLSDDGIRDVVFSLYISAKDSEENILTVKENKSIIVRVPSERLTGMMEIGTGFVSDNAIAWDYSSDNNIEYTEWEKVNEDNSSEVIHGYEFTVEDTGWYTLSVINDNPFDLIDICMTLNNDKLNKDNTIVYTLLDSHQYLLQAQYISSDSYCNYNLPVTGNTVKIISISYLEDEGRFYYASKTATTNSLEGSIDLSPAEIDQESLLSELYSL